MEKDNKYTKMQKDFYEKETPTMAIENYIE